MTPARLVGRDAECRRIDGLLEAAAAELRERVRWLVPGEPATCRSERG